MKIEEFIAVLPAYLQANPTACSAESLAALDQILVALDTVAIAQTRDDFVNWLRTYTDVRDQIKAYAETNREMGQQRPAPAHNEATIVQNDFQTLRQVRRDQAPKPDKPTKA